MFVQRPRSSSAGCTFPARLIALMYILPSFTNGIQGLFGHRRPRITLRSSLLEYGRARSGRRAFLVLQMHLEIEALPWSCPARAGFLPCWPTGARAGVKFFEERRTLSRTLTNFLRNCEFFVNNAIDKAPPLLLLK